MDIRRKLPQMDITKKLPEELLQEILARLPLKSILEFRSVCKSWRILIDNPSFFSLQLNVSEVNRRKKLLISLEYGKNYFLRLRHSTTLRISDELLKDCNLRIYGYVNGLILAFWPWKKQFRLYNPSIMKCLLIPQCSLHQNSVVSLGYDASVKDFKILVFDVEAGLMHIYAVSVGSWYTKDIDEYVGRGWLFEPNGVYYTGTLYFLIDTVTQNTVEKVVKSCDMKYTNMALFDCAREHFTFGELPQLDLDESGVDQRVLFILDNSVALIDVARNGNSIWVLKNSGNVNSIWTKSYHTVSAIIPAMRSLRCYSLSRCCDLNIKVLKRLLNLARDDSLMFIDFFVESLALSEVNGALELHLIDKQ